MELVYFFEYLCAEDKVLSLSHFGCRLGGSDLGALLLVTLQPFLRRSKFNVHAQFKYLFC